ncbi:cytochrome P450 Tp4149, partial [Tanacetum coccineum]
MAPPLPVLSKGSDDIFAAGTETSATTIEMAISELVRNPRVMKKVQLEVTEIAQGRSMIEEKDLEKMHYLKAVIKETLRLHPPTPLLPPRQSTQDVKLMGYDIPAGTQVMINAWAIARDPASWQEPTEFKPERFLTNPMNYKGHHFEWVPFGAGRRECPGIQFGVAVIELALANVVYKFDLGLPNGVKDQELDMSETFGGLVLRPRIRTGRNIASFKQSTTSLVKCLASDTPLSMYTLHTRKPSTSASTMRALFIVLKFCSNLLDKTSIKALLLDAYTAGADTTATVLEWTTAELPSLKTIWIQISKSYSTQDAKVMAYHIAKGNTVM